MKDLLQILVEFSTFQSKKQFLEKEHVDESDFHKFIADFPSLFVCKI